MDYSLFFTIVGSAVAIIVALYQFLRNVRTDIKDNINAHIDRLERRMDAFDAKMTSLEERMFLLATGKSLGEALLEERRKKEEAERQRPA